MNASDWFDYVAEKAKQPRLRGLEQSPVAKTTPPETKGIEVQESFMDTVKMAAFRKGLKLP